MSLENIEKFYEILTEDGDLRNKIAGINSEIITEGRFPTPEQKRKIIERILPIAKELVGDVSFEDFNQFEIELEENVNSDVLGNIGGGVFSNSELGPDVFNSQDNQKNNSDGVCIGLGIANSNTCVIVGK